MSLYTWLPVGFEAAKLKDGGEKTIETYFEATDDPGGTSELFYASGGSLITGTGKIMLKRVGNVITATGSIRNVWSDSYDWNEGQSAYIPGVGIIDDDDGIYLLDYGAADNKMSSSWNTKVSGTITIRSFWFNSNDVKFVNYSKD
jgi:hypothetical protein